ncbi:MAG: GxxExxY protein [Alphaproteobacteria bacterium]|nr:GxxExxY protein [Alphaproteobacteria bacterium]MBU1516159.1 GxxExxY protein [Alphaproteobacteria bacterium]MBU2097108.1 GxxExxY protein [Alphaproteobacteria bacterium]MBU2152076.1 GxxExxY protein [Alphaproteobacteria bacterium]MBU2306287.1 GxxExxY protein [Alphaproteobacteria bacterium]
MDHEDHKGHKEHEGFPAGVEAAGRAIVDAAIKIHRVLGPGLLESAYEHCLAHELGRRGLRVRRQVALPIEFEGLRLDAGYRLDMIVDDVVVVEVKAVEALSRLHEAQILTYLRLSGLRLGYLLNFNAVQMRQGLRRFVH